MTFSGKSVDSGSSLSIVVASSSGVLNSFSFGISVRRCSQKRFVALESDEELYKDVKYTYDANKNIASEEFFDTDGNPILSADGFHKGVYTWDDAKHKLTERYYGIDGNPIVIKKGYAGVDHEYDDFGNDKKCKYYDVNGNIAANKAGTVIVNTET